MTTITKVLTLMNFQGSYDVSTKDPLFQGELNWVFLHAGVHPTTGLFISYAYKGNNYPVYFKAVSDIFTKAGITLTDITSGNPATLIAAAKIIVVGGGDITTFVIKMNSLITPTFNPYTAIKNGVDSGVPYIGWNEGSGIVSPKYFTPPSGSLLTGINASPFQIVTNYSDSPQSKTAIFNFLTANPVISKVICQVDAPHPDGSSVRLEDSGAGMIDSATDPYPTVIHFKIVGGVLQES